MTSMLPVSLRGQDSAYLTPRLEPAMPTHSSDANIALLSLSWPQYQGRNILS